MSDEFDVKGPVEVFPGKGGWYFVRVPKEYNEITKGLAQSGLVAIEVTLDEAIWKTSLLPMGDGTQFIALPAKIRKVNKIELDDNVELKFRLRER